MFEKHGKSWEEKPVRYLFQQSGIHKLISTQHTQRDMITWFLEESEPHQRDPTKIAIRILRINFAGLMSTSFVCLSSFILREYLMRSGDRI